MFTRIDHAMSGEDDRRLGTQTETETGHAAPATGAPGDNYDGGQLSPQPVSSKLAAVDWTDVVAGPSVDTYGTRAGGADGVLSCCLRLAWAIFVLAAALSLVGYKTYLDWKVKQPAPPEFYIPDAKIN